MTSTLTITATASPTTPAGMSLRVSVNGTTIHEGGNVAITATLVNTLDQNNNVSTSYKWPFYGLLMFNQNWPPCVYYSPFELVVLRGNYSSGQLIAMGPGGGPGYGCMEDWAISSFMFEPNSDLTYFTASWGVTRISTSGPVNTSVTVTTNGYWDNSSSLTYPTPYAGLGQYNFLAAQHSFVQGVYTVAVADEWGQLDVVHLTVE